MEGSLAKDKERNMIEERTKLDPGPDCKGEEKQKKTSDQRRRTHDRHGRERHTQRSHMEKTKEVQKVAKDGLNGQRYSSKDVGVEETSLRRISE